MMIQTNSYTVNMVNKSDEMALNRSPGYKGVIIQTI